MGNSDGVHNGGGSCCCPTANPDGLDASLAGAAVGCTTRAAFDGSVSLAPVPDHFSFEAAAKPGAGELNA
jgi:hypothetical protein